MRSQRPLREKYRTNRGTPFAGKLARRTLDEENFLRLIETLEDGVNRGEAIRVLGEVQTDRFETIPDFCWRHRPAGVLEHDAARVGQPPRHGGNEPAQPIERAYRLCELGESFIDFASLCAERLVLADGGSERLTILFGWHT